MSDVGIVWLRQDLRLADQPALAAAVAQHKQVVPLYIWSPNEEGEWAPGAASRWWLHDSLASLAASLEGLGSGLILRQGASLEVLEAMIEKTGARAVYWNARYEPIVAAQDAKIRKALAERGVEVVVANGSLLQDPESIRNKTGNPYLVYGAFWRAAAEKSVGAEVPAPTALAPLPKGLSSDVLANWELKPKIAWDLGLRRMWRVGEVAAQAALRSFCGDGIAGYAEGRDIPGRTGTSRLSPHLHFGELSPRQVWLAARRSKAPGAMTYLKEIVWREFSYYLLHHHPRLTNEPLRPEFKEFRWEGTPSQLAAWQRGMTGFPIVDAGMRELWETGWMHNRVRMIVASFLVKDLRIHWLEGARWFWDTLVDADLASNTQGWQWTSGCGADAAPYFRVFNPSLQEKKFDPDGAYVRRWVPEVGTAAYPKPIVDHDRARFAALKAFDQIKKKA